MSHTELMGSSKERGFALAVIFFFEEQISFLKMILINYMAIQYLIGYFAVFSL